MKSALDILKEELGEKRISILQEHGLLTLVQWAMVVFKDQAVVESNEGGSAVNGKPFRCMFEELHSYEKCENRCAYCVHTRK